MNSDQGSREPSVFRRLTVLERGSASESRSSTAKSGDEIEIGSAIRVGRRISDRYRYEDWKPVHHDLLVVCGAVEYADRRWGHHSKQRSRQFQITLPVQELTVWQSPQVQASLQDTLRHLTGDEWEFSFVQAWVSAEDDFHVSALPFRENKTCVIPYSDGLDSLCASGIYGANDSDIRVRATNSKVPSRNGRQPFDRIPIEVKVEQPNETDLRYRGFKFLAIGAIAAHLAGVPKIIVPESGQGALGPALVPRHNIYPDYRSHPTFLRKMEEFIKALLGIEAAYAQPRLWFTKGQTLKAYLNVSGDNRESLLGTRSCWQQRWNARLDRKLGQCGLCAACLLRRMSMHSVGISEPAAKYTISDLKASRYKNALPETDRVRLSDTLLDYGIVGVRYLQRMADMAALPASASRPDVVQIAHSIGASEKDTRTNLKRLLSRHAEEWHDFVSAQGKHSFIKAWTT